MNEGVKECVVQFELYPLDQELQTKMLLRVQINNINESLSQV